MLHIYTAPKQPATKFVDINFDPPMTFRWPKRRLRRCWRCHKLRRCENLLVQVFYDGLRFWCKKKCKE